MVWTSRGPKMSQTTSIAHQQLPSIKFGCKLKLPESLTAGNSLHNTIKCPDIKKPYL